MLLYIRTRDGADFEYHNDEAKTSAAHLEPGVFSVGDVGYVDEDGYVFLADRKIDMIISGGVNIYPAEIEGVLQVHPAVADAAVIGVPNEEFGEEVKAIVQLRDGVAATDELPDELRTWCRERLASFKVPRSVDFVDTVPRSAAGKLEKRGLRERYWADAGRAI